MSKGVLGLLISLIVFASLLLGPTLFAPAQIMQQVIGNTPAPSGSSFGTVTYPGSPAGCGGTSCFTNGTSTTSGAISITVAGSNPVLLIAVMLNSATATVSSVTSGSGTATDIKSSRNGAVYVDVWSIVAPSAGATTATANFSASVPFQVSVILLNGASQTVPTPSSDAATACNSGTGNTTCTPNVTNLVTGNLDFCAGGLITSGNPLGVTPTSINSNSSTAVNGEVGYGTDTTQCAATFNGASNVVTTVGVRVQ